MIPKYKVSEFINKIKDTLDEHISSVDIIGEVFEVKSNEKSGHIYFKLKEESFSVSCVCWKSNANKYEKFLKEGLTIRIRAKPSLFKNTNLYLSANYIFLYGEGNIAQYKKDLELKLKKEGLFDNKKPIPKYPEIIGLITSKDGAALQDILRTLKDKLPCKIILYNVNVQGEESVKNIINGINIFNTTNTKVDVLIIARGGGSSEDLFHFNDENLVRTVSKSNIPIITAIGHETDTTLVDLAADSFRHTPTASVDFLNNKYHLVSYLENILDSSIVKLLNHINIKSNYIKLLQLKVISPKTVLDVMMNKVIENKRRSLFNFKEILNKYNNFILLSFQNIKSNIQKSVISREYALQNSSIKKHKIQAPIYAKIHQFKLHSSKMASMPDKISEYQNRLININKLIDAMNMEKYLKKGFSILHKQENNKKIVSSVKDLSNGKYQLEFHDGSVNINIIVLNSDNN